MHRTASSVRSMLLVSSVMASSLFALPAHGQVTVPGSPADEAPQAVDSSSNGIGDIVVTARRRAESAQSVPVALTALTADRLEQRSIRNLEDVQQIAPSLRLVPGVSTPTSPFMSMRGQTATPGTQDIDGSIVFYVDGTAIPASRGALAFSTLDVARVEVLRGPQGTLFGKSTTGGAISITTELPKHEFEGLVRTSFGNYGDWRLGGVVNVPISSTLAARFVSSYSHRGRVGTNLFTGQGYGTRKDLYFRGSLLWEPTDAVSVVIRGDYGDYRNRQLGFNGVSNIVPTGLAVVAVSRELGITLPAAAARLATYDDGGASDGSTSVHPNEILKVYGASVTATWQAGPAFTLKSITSVRGFDMNNPFDLDGTPFRIIERSSSTQKNDSFYQELQGYGDLINDRLNYMVGLYYSRESGTDNNDVVSIFALNPVITANANDVLNKSFGVFGQSTFRFSEHLSATGGIRYSKDWRNLTSYNHNQTTCLALGRLLTAGPCVYVVPEATFNAVSYTASLEYKPTAGVLLYVKTDRGYRSGGLQESGGHATSPIAAAASYAPFAPEFVKDIELGIKADWFNHTLRTNITYYHSDYTNIQRSRSVTPPGTLLSIARIENVAAAKIDGVEGEVEWRPLRGLELNGTVSYTRPRYIDYKLPSASQKDASGNPVMLDQTGSPFLLTPKWSFGLAAAYTLGTSFGNVRAAVDYFHEGRVVTAVGSLIGDPQIVPNAERAAYGLTNARLSAHFDRGEWDMALYARNLFDVRRYMFPVSVPGLGFTFNGLTNEPRTYGVEVTKRF